MATRRKTTRTRRVRQRFPPGWNEERVKKVIAHYEQQTEEQLAGEIEAAEPADQTLMLVPNGLVPVVRKLIAQHQKTA